MESYITNQKTASRISLMFQKFVNIAEREDYCRLQDILQINVCCIISLIYMSQNDIWQECIFVNVIDY